MDSVMAVLNRTSFPCGTILHGHSKDVGTLDKLTDVAQGKMRYEKERLVCCALGVCFIILASTVYSKPADIPFSHISVITHLSVGAEHP